jgi:hypothetical protein
VALLTHRRSLGGRQLVDARVELLIVGIFDVLLDVAMAGDTAIARKRGKTWPTVGGLGELIG